MRRYPLTLRDRLRFRYGLAWASALPTWPDIRRRLPGLLYAVALVLLVGFAHTRQYAEEMADEAAAQAQSNRALTAALATCVSTLASDTDAPQAHFVPTTQEGICERY